MIKTIAGKRLLYVMATEAEYGPYLSSLFFAADDWRWSGRGCNQSDAGSHRI